MTIEKKQDSSWCFDILADQASRRERLETAVFCYTQISDYLARFRKLQEAQNTYGEVCDLAAQQLADQAYDAERYMRILANLGLATANELFSTHRFEEAVKEVAKLASDQTLSVMALFHDLQANLEQNYPGLPTSFLTDAFNYISPESLRVRGERERLRVFVSNGDGEQSFVIAPGVRTGDLGSIRKADFFNPEPATILSVFPIPVLEDCHYAPPIRTSVSDLSAEEPIDVYEMLLAAMVFGKEVMYRHAREIAEIGVPPYRGEAIGVASVLAIIFIIIGIVLAIAGTITTNLGKILGGLGTVLLGVLCLATGVCKVVDSRLTAVAAT